MCLRSEDRQICKAPSVTGLLRLACRSPRCAGICVSYVKKDTKAPFLRRHLRTTINLSNMASRRLHLSPDPLVPIMLVVLPNLGTQTTRPTRTRTTPISPRKASTTEHRLYRRKALCEWVNRLRRTPCLAVNRVLQQPTVGHPICS